MISFNDKPIYFRTVFLLLLICLLSIAAVNLYRFSGAVTDENIFVTTPARLMARKTVPAQITRVFSKSADTPQETRGDSLRAGYLVAQINDVRVTDVQQAQQLIRQGREQGRLVFFVPFYRYALAYKVNADFVDDDFLLQLPPSVAVIDIAKGGASDRAGMRVGDLIVRINNQGFTDARSADFILRSNLPGKTIAYDVYRGTELITLKVILARFGAPLAALVFILSGMFYMVVGAFIALARPTIKPARLLGLSMILIGFFMCVVMSRRDLLPSFFTMLRDLAVDMSLIFSIALFFHSSLYFPQELTAIVKRRWILPILYGLAGIGALTVIIFRRTPLSIPVMMNLLIFSATVLLLFKKDIPAEYKRMSWPLKFTRVVVVATIVLILVWTFAGPASTRFRVGYIGLPLAAIPLAYLYTISRYRLLNMDLRIRRNIQYNLIAALWFCLFVAVWGIVFALLLQVEVEFPRLTMTSRSLEVIDAPLSADEKILAEKGLIMVLVIGFSLMLRKIYRTGRHFLNRKFYRAVYDYRRASTTLAELLAAKSDLHELAHNLILYLRDVMRLKRLGVILMRNGERMPITIAEGMETLEWQDFVVAYTPRLLQLCDSSPDQARFRVDYLSAGDKELLRRHGLLFITPLRSGDKILGAIMVGEKLAETPYHEEDLELLVVAARQAVVAVENALLYEELSQQERLRHELEIARRIQLSSLPQTTPKISGLDVAGTSVPATEVGGDYFDYLNGRDGNLTVVVGDVSGKGISAALYISKMQGILRSLHGFDLSPRDLFIRANAILVRDIEKQYFITALGVCFDYHAKKMIVTRAGHLPLFHYSAATDEIATITPKGIGFGLERDNEFAEELQEKTVRFERNDVVVLVTDGLTEAKNRRGDEFGEERLIGVVRQTAGQPAAGICRAVTDAVRLFAQNNNQYDDQTIVVVKIA